MMQEAVIEVMTLEVAQALARQFLATASIMQALRAWMIRGKITVGHVERTHSTDKTSFGQAKKSNRTVEHGVLHSFCRKLLT